MIWKEKSETRFEAHGIPDEHDIQVLSPLNDGDDWMWTVTLEYTDPVDPERINSIISAGTASTAASARAGAQQAYQRALHAMETLKHGAN